MKFRYTYKYTTQFVVFFLVIFSFSCKSVKAGHENYGKYSTEKLDIEFIYGSKNYDSAEHEIKVYHIDVHRTSDGIGYLETNFNSGLCKYIQGNRTDGFIEVVFSMNDEFGIRKGFWPNGNIKFSEKLYVGQFPQKDRLLKIGFPIEFTNYYNKAGKLSKRVNNDKPFAFTLTDIKNYLRNKGIDFSSKEKSATIDRSYFNHVAVWDLSYYDYFQQIMFYIKINGFNGKELGVTKAKIFEGNSNKLYQQQNQPKKLK